MEKEMTTFDYWMESVKKADKYAEVAARLTGFLVAHAQYSSDLPASKRVYILNLLIKTWNESHPELQNTIEWTKTWKEMKEEILAS